MLAESALLLNVPNKVVHSCYGGCAEAVPHGVDEGEAREELLCMSVREGGGGVRESEWKGAYNLNMTLEGQQQ